MRLRPELTIDYSEDPKFSAWKSAKHPMSIVYFHDELSFFPRFRPWFHLRYHSSFPVIDPSPEDKGPLFQTLHLIVCHRLDEAPGAPTYLHPHETDDSDRLPKILAHSLETSSSQYLPPNDRIPRELQTLTRRVVKRKAGNVTRLDFTTRFPLNVEYDFDAHPLPEVTWSIDEVPFVAQPPSRTRQERASLRWRTAKLNEERLAEALARREAA